MKLTPRLMAIADKVNKGDKIIDVGTDHAYVPIYLTLNNIVSYAIASDVRQGPLKIAEKNISKYGLSLKVDTVLSDGLDNVSLNNIDTVIIAGMGGLLISEILSKNISKLKGIKKIILQPMQFIEELRKWIYNNGYTIIDEELVKEDSKIYNILTMQEGKEEIEDDFFYYIGKKLIEKKHPLLKEHIMKEIKRFRKILDNISFSKNLENSKIEILSVSKLEKLINLYSQLYGGFNNEIG